MTQQRRHDSGTPDQAVSGRATSDASASHTSVVAADADRIMDILTDFTQYPRWVAAIRSAEVTALDDDRRPRRVAFVLAASVVEDEYELEYRYDDDGRGISWDLVEPTPLQSAQHGSYRLAPGPQPGTTEVTYTLDVSLTVGMIGGFRQRAERRILSAALEDLARRVEQA